MNGHDFTLADARLCALPSGALHWPAAAALIVSDLHFGKSARLARRGGGLLPPYDTTATLTRLAADIDRTGPRHVLCLGDSFDDLQAETEMDEADRLWLTRLMAGRDWTWVLGNHDPGPLSLPGTHRAEVTLGPLAFCHIANPARTAEVSGHYHPKARLAGRARPCFLLGNDRLILPAYGAYTGGMRANDPVFATLMGPKALALLTGPRVIAMPMAAG